MRAPTEQGKSADLAEPWLERAGDPELGAPTPNRPRKKVRAEERATREGGSDAVSVMLVAALGSEHCLAAALWPDVKPGDLLRTPPPPEAFSARCEWARRAIDAVGRKDDESRARAVVAQRVLENKLARAAEGGASVRDSALVELEGVQLAELVELARVLSSAGKELKARDMTRLDEAALERGVEASRARDALRRAGYSQLEAEARGWSAFMALPGAPKTMDAVAYAMLQNPTQAAEVVRSGAVLGWLRENNAAPEVISRARDARMTIERAASGASESLAVHSQAWSLGRRELVVGGSWLRAPGEIAPAVRGGNLSLDELARSAREGVLAAWLRMHGWMAASGAADLVARSQDSGMKRLAWSLGEPLVLGDASFVDPATLARAALTNSAVRAGVIAAHSAGDLLAWLESLPPALRDEHWIERLRRGRESHGDDQMPMWMGVYAQARAAALELFAGRGHSVSVTSVGQLKITTMVAEVWDDLKRAFRTGELQAWLAQSMGQKTSGGERPPTDEDSELNELLWSLGHTGLVLEWGPEDFAVTTPSDLVRAYQTGWQRLESQIARGYVLTWLGRFHGERLVGPVKTRELCASLRAEAPRLPAGVCALKLALISGLRYLPLDPSQPGDQANFRGYSGVARAQSDPRAWEPLQEHMTQGTGLLWLAQQPSVREVDARLMLALAFVGPVPAGAEPMAQRAARLLMPYGEPVPSAALAAELRGAAPQKTLVSGAKTAQSGASWGIGRALALALLLLSVGALAAYWQHMNEQDLVADPNVVGESGRSVRVSVQLAVKVPRSDHGEPWDLDHSPPDLNLYLVTPGGARLLRACQNDIECRAEDAASLEPRRIFEVLVREADPLGETELCRARINWTGGRDESLHTRSGDCDLQLRIRRTDAISTAPYTITPVTTRSLRPPAGLTDGGRGRADGSRRTGRRR